MEEGENREHDTWRSVDHDENLTWQDLRLCVVMMNGPLDSLVEESVVALPHVLRYKQSSRRPHLWVAEADVPDPNICTRVGRVFRSPKFPTMSSRLPLSRPGPRRGARN